MFKQYNIKLFAFTLAEVLITMGIIGIIAEMTIPTLMQNAEITSDRAAFKKAYSVFDQATRQIVNDYGGNISSVITTYDESLMYLYTPYFAIQKICPESSANGVCWHNDGDWKRLDNTDFSRADDGVENGLKSYDPAGFILNDGMLVRVYSHRACSIYLPDDCGYFFIDVNGFKPPNRVGRDIFGIHVKTNRIVAFGARDSGYADDCNTSDNGMSCAGQVLMNINY